MKVTEWPGTIVWNGRELLAGSLAFFWNLGQTMCMYVFTCNCMYFWEIAPFVSKILWNRMKQSIV